MISEHGLLFIEPQEKSSETPLIDEATRKMTAAIRKAEESGCMGVMNADGFFAFGVSTRGFHVCSCGKAHSGSHDYILANRTATNSMCVHYLAYHRSEVPQDQLNKVLALNEGELEPTEADLKGATWMYKKQERVTRG